MGNGDLMQQFKQQFKLMELSLALIFVGICIMLLTAFAFVQFTKSIEPNLIYLLAGFALVALIPKIQSKAQGE